MNTPKALTLPLSCEAISQLKAGDFCTLTGPAFTLRDAGHMRLLEEMRALESENPSGARAKLPYNLAGQTIFYAGPTPAAANRPFGAIGPTTASRMDFAAPLLYEAGIVATIGKGSRSQKVIDACKNAGAVYFAAVGGAAAFLAKCVESSETISYDELGTEALRRIELVDFPVFVGIDVSGANIYELEK